MLVSLYNPRGRDAVRELNVFLKNTTQKTVCIYNNFALVYTFASFFMVKKIFVRKICNVILSVWAACDE